MATTAGIILYRAPGGAAGWRPAKTARAVAGLVPPAVSVVAGMVSAQVGAAVAKYLFAALGPAATVSLRTAFAALVLLLVWRPRLRGRTRADLLAALALGVTLAGLSLSFYAALERIPLGVAMTLEFAGPLGLALVGSRRRLDLLWGVLAVAGILVLSPIGGTVDPLGGALALLGGAFWAISILLSARIGRTIPGGGGAGAGDGGGRDRHAPVRRRRRRAGRRGSSVAPGRARGGAALLGRPLFAGARGVAPHPGPGVRRADEPGAGDRRPGGAGALGRGARDARDGRDRPRGDRQCRRHQDRRAGRGGRPRAGVGAGPRSGRAAASSRRSRRGCPSSRRPRSRSGPR